VASSGHIPPILSQNVPNRQMQHTITEVLETADTLILLAKVDVSSHNGPYVRIAGHDIPKLAI